jgi:hypothetical protein
VRYVSKRKTWLRASDHYIMDSLHKDFKAEPHIDFCIVPVVSLKPRSVHPGENGSRVPTAMGLQAPSFYWKNIVASLIKGGKNEHKIFLEKLLKNNISLWRYLAPSNLTIPDIYLHCLLLQRLNIFMSFCEGKSIQTWELEDNKRMKEIYYKDFNICTLY